MCGIGRKRRSSRPSRGTSGFTSDLEYFALLFFMGCIGAFLVSVVSGRTKLPSSLFRLLGAVSVGVLILLSLIIIFGVNRWVRRLRGHSNHENAEVL